MYPVTDNIVHFILSLNISFKDTLKKFTKLILFNIN